MREILFRGKYIQRGLQKHASENTKWVYGSLILRDDYCCILESPEDIHPMDDPYLDGNLGTIDGFATPIDPDTVGQYTGLTDKNGKKIFEGDVLQFFEKRLVVWWNEEAFQWQAQERKEVTCTYSGASICGIFDNIDLGRIYAEIPCLGKTSTEVIGNRWDNPELLEEVSDNG